MVECLSLIQNLLEMLNCEFNYKEKEFRRIYVISLVRKFGMTAFDLKKRWNCTVTDMTLYKIYMYDHKHNLETY